MSKVRFIIAFLLSFVLIPASGQDLPTLSSSSRFVRGTLPNGIAYYLTANTTTKGYANFALVQKNVVDKDHARAGLDQLPKFYDKAPYKFLASHGAGYTPDGYISYAGGSAIFNFEDIPCFQSALCDSTLAILLTVASRFAGEQAIIICGDIDVAKTKDHLQIMSMMAEKPAGKVREGRGYEWNPRTEMRVIRTDCRTSRLCEITARYASPRTPAKNMNTPQPLVSQMYANQLQYIFRKRAEVAFEAAGIPLAYAKGKYVSSANTNRDELYEFCIGVDDADRDRAVTLLAGILSGLDSQGCTADEFFDSRMHFGSEVFGEAARRLDNRDYVQSCVSNFLYGANLVDQKAVYDFFRGRQISQERDLSLFNRFVAALLDPACNLTLVLNSPAEEIDLGESAKTFSNGWKDASGLVIKYEKTASDTLGLYYPVGKKLKIKSEQNEPMTGGTAWTFSNGMKVVFRKSSDAQIRYTYLLRGGFPEVPGLERGENAFVGDMLDLYNIGEMSPSRFHNMLEANGISMKCTASVTDLRISGTALPYKLPLLLRSLLSIEKQRSLNKEAFQYYKSCEALRLEATRLSTEGVNAVMDSIMCPDFFYPPSKSIACLTDGLPEKCERYFAAQFSKNNDGVLFIEGNLDPDQLKKTLCASLGNFSTIGGYSTRPRLDYQLRSGWTTYIIDSSNSTVGDGGLSTNVALSALRPFTMQNWCAFRIAVEAFRVGLVKELADLGQNISIEPQLQLQPSERVAIFINCSPCPTDGLPSGVEAADPLDVLDALRLALNKMYLYKISPAELKGLKAALANEIASEMADPDYLMEAYMRRVSEGKDMISNYSTYLEKVTADDVQAVIMELSQGSKVEYVLK